jgi:CDP-2,3-bis-(O-geranylgeranyl)-sn-glycerol synthase
MTTDPNISAEELKRTFVLFSIFFVLVVVYIVVWTLMYSIWDVLCVMGLAFFGCVPAFLANAFMPIFGSLKFIPRKPIDGGRMLRGNRLFGEHKTWNGFIGGTILGFIVAYLLAISIYPKLYAITLLNFSDGETVLEFLTMEEILFFVDIESNPTKFFIGQFLLCIGAPLGDLIGSFVKRRFNRKDGTQFPVIDQIDFIVIAVLLAYPLYPIQWYYMLFLIIITPMITITANIIGYYTGKKEVPW